MRSLRRLVAVALAAACVVPGCGNKDDPAAAFNAFASEYCNLTSKCCSEAKEQDAGQCTTAFRQLGALFGAKYDAARGDACLAKLRADKACDFSDAQVACNDVLGTKGTSPGTKHPGEACTSTSDCAMSADGPVDCYFGSISSANGSSTVQICQVQAPGVASGPCDGDLRKDGTHQTTGISNGPPPAVAHYCEQAKGLTCDSTAKTCTQLIDDGGACTTWQSCASGVCDSGDKCAVRSAVGGPCAPTIGPCVDGAYCDNGSCAMKLATGSPCSSFDACVGFCDSQKMTCIGDGNASPPLGCFSQGSAK